MTSISKTRMPKAYLEERMNGLEAMFDKHYPGWRDAVVVKRMSKKAMVQSMNVTGNRLLPVRVENVPFYFCGEETVARARASWPNGRFPSARRAAKLSEEVAREKAALPV